MGDSRYGIGGIDTEIDSRLVIRVVTHQGNIGAVQGGDNLHLQAFFF